MLGREREHDHESAHERLARAIRAQMRAAPLNLPVEDLVERLCTDRKHRSRPVRARLGRRASPVNHPQLSRWHDPAVYAPLCFRRSLGEAPINDGSERITSATLDLCGYVASSEGRRVARSVAAYASG